MAFSEKQVKQVYLIYLFFVFNFFSLFHRIDCTLHILNEDVCHIMIIMLLLINYTEQNYKHNTFVFAPIFQELNSKI